MNYERFELHNGLRVLAAPMPALGSVTVAVLVGVGSRWESDAEAGTSHLIEHLLFKGTRRRPSAAAISETIERVGGAMNASTDKEATVYWTKTASTHLALSIDLLADMLLNSRLTPGDVGKEKTIILEELGMSLDDPQDWVHALADEAMWPDHPLGRDVAGTKDTLRGLSRPTVRRFLSSHYGPNRAVLVVAGGVKPRLVQDLAHRYLDRWEPVKRGSYVPAPESTASPAFRFDERPTEQAHVCVAFPALSRYDPDRFGLDVMSTILGGSTTSRLFLTLRERLALAYDVHVYTIKLADAGSLVVYAGVDPHRGPDAVRAIFHEVDRLRRRVVPADELLKTLEFMKGRLHLGLEDSHAVASWLGAQELLMNEIRSPESVVRQLEAITPADIRRVANRVLRPDAVRLAFIGPNPESMAAAVPA